MPRRALATFAILAAVGIVGALVHHVARVPGGVRPPERLPMPHRFEAILPESETPATTRTVSARRAMRSGSTEPNVCREDAEVSGRIDVLLARVRELAERERFHAEVWSTVRELSAAIPCEDGGAIRIASVVHDPTAHQRVRAACLLSLALAGPEDSVRRVAVPLRWDHASEVQRAAWLALVLAHDGAPGVRLQTAEFESSTGLTTFPVRLAGRASPEDIDAALERVTTEVGREYAGLGAQRKMPIRDETYTCELIVLSVLGTSVGEPGPIRGRLLAWAESKGLPISVVRDVSMYCLATTARSDPNLAEQLAGIVRRSSTDMYGGTLLRLFVERSGRCDLVFETIRGMLDAPHGALNELNTIEALSALLSTIQSGDPELTWEANELLVERALDPGTLDRDRTTMLAVLAVARSDVLFDVARLTFESESDPHQRLMTARFLGFVDPASKGKSCDFLIHAYDPHGDLELQKAVLKSLARLDIAESESFLAHVAATESNAQLSAYVQTLLE